MSVEDQNQVITEYNAAHNKPYSPPAVGGYSDTKAAEATATYQAANPPAAAPAASSAAAKPSWVFAVNLPSTYPDFAGMKQSGTGIVIVQDDPNFQILYDGAKSWGIPIAIQVNAPPGITPADYAARVASAQQFAPNKLVLDVEDAGKGYEGSAGWNFSQQVADLIKPIVGNTSVSVTMPPNQDDYNYKAYTDLGADVWVQSYAGDMTPIDPNATVARVAANGVDPSKITAVVGPNQAAPSGGNFASFGIYTGVPGAPGSTGSGGQVTGGAPKPGTYIPGTSSTYNVTPGGQALANAYGAAAPTSGPNAGGTPSTTPSGAPATDFAGAYFGGMGLPPDVVDKVNSIFKQYIDQPDLAVQLARQYIHTTPWFSQTFPGYFEGVRTGLFGDEAGYRSYVSQANTYTMQYFNRAITIPEVESAMTQGWTPEYLGRTYESTALVAAQGEDWMYTLGAFGDTPPSGAQGYPNASNPDERGQLAQSLGRQQAGLPSEMGERLQTALDKAKQRMAAIFGGQTATPNTASQALAPKAPDLPA
jgi:hypothetical protein